MECGEEVILFHVWGHFAHSGTSKLAFNKAIKSLNENGKLILCYNTNDDFVGELVKFCKKLFSNFQYDQFDESLLDGIKFKEIEFDVSLSVELFEELTDLIQVLVIAEDVEFESKKSEILDFLKSHLDVPKFKIKQKIVITTPDSSSEIL